MTETIEILDPKTRNLVATISVNGGPPEIFTADRVLESEFLKRLPGVLAGGNKIWGLMGADSACYHKEFSPTDVEYWPSLCHVVGDYLMRDPKTGEVF